MNNNQNHVIKQINRVATPIKVDANGNRIEEPVQPQQVVQQPNAFTNAKLSDVNTVNTKVKEHDPSTMIFITVMLIIFAFATSYICYVILPRENDYKTSKYAYNDVDVTYNSIDTSFIYPETIINNGNNITGTIKEALSESFVIEKTESNDILINNKVVTNNEILFPKFYYVSNMVIFGVKNNATRTTMVFIVDKEGNVVNKYYTMEAEKGMVLGDTSNTFSFEAGNIILHFSRVYGSTLYSGLEYGSLETMDLCSTDNTHKATADLKLTHVGKGFFKEEITSSITLGEYKQNSNLCR